MKKNIIVWFKRVLFKIRNLFSKKKYMKLPTIKNPSPPPQDLIDKVKIPYVSIWIDKDGKKYIGIFIDGFLYRINWSINLEYWLSISGILLVWFPSPPYELEYSTPENVINIPVDLPNPVTENFKVSNKPNTP